MFQEDLNTIHITKFKVQNNLHDKKPRHYKSNEPQWWNSAWQNDSKKFHGSSACPWHFQHRSFQPLQHRRWAQTRPGESNGIQWDFRNGFLVSATAVLESMRYISKLLGRTRKVHSGFCFLTECLDSGKPAIPVHIKIGSPWRLDFSSWNGWRNWPKKKARSETLRESEDDQATNIVA